MYSIRLLKVILLFPIIVALFACGGGGSSDTPPGPTLPEVDAVTPLAFSESALVTSVVTAQFNKDMEPQTINDPKENIYVIDNISKQQVDGSVLYWGTYLKVHDNVAVFTPDNDLVAGREYIATVTTDVTDTSGDSIASDYSWSFIIAPMLVPVSIDAASNFGNTGIDTLSPSVPNATGEYIVFASTDNLAGVDTGGRSQIYRKNTTTGRVELVSINTSDKIANSHCYTPRISDTGRYVVFSSDASNLTAGIPTHGYSHIYLKDVRDGDISLLDKSIANPGEAGNGDSRMPDISGIPDTGSGKYVVFQSNANDLHADDTDATATNADSDIFLINIVSDTVELISVDSDEEKGNGASIAPRVSENGKRVVFESVANNLAAPDSNTTSDIFMRDLNATTTTHISVASGDSASNGPSNNADISADGNYVVFQSDATNLLAVIADNNGVMDVFLRDIGASSTTRLSVDANGDQVTGASSLPSISGNGQYVAFESQSTLLITPDTNGDKSDVFVRVRNIANTIKRLSVDNNDVQGNDTSISPAISVNGRYVSFTTPNQFDTTDFPSTNDIYRAYNSAYQ